MEFDIYELKVVISTNISTNKEIILTKDLIPHIEDSVSLNTYPYFTIETLYLRESFIQLTYQERIRFFFNKERFKELLSSYHLELPKENETNNTENRKSSRRNKIVENNIMVMLELILPTRFPAIKDLKQSFNVVFNKDRFTDHLYETYYTHPFSYLKINGKIYTVKRVVWLNDILNHPIYKRLLEQYRKFWTWTREEKMKIKNNNQTGIIIDIVRKCFKKIIDSMNEFINENKNMNFSLQTKTKKNNSDLLDKLIVLYKLWYYLNKIDRSQPLDCTKLTIRLQEVRLQEELTDELKKIESEIEKKDPAEAITELVKTIAKKDNAKSIIIIYSIKEKKDDKLVKKDDGYKPVVLNKPPPSENDLQYIKNDIVIQLDTMKKHYDAIDDSMENIRNTINHKGWGNIDMVDYMLTLPYATVASKYDGKDKHLPPEYRNFVYTVLNQEFRKPFRETTNNSLQTMIDSKTENDVKNFFKFMQYTYEYYFRNNAKLKFTKEDRSLMRVDMNYINTNQNVGVKREIHVLVDFIEGEITDANVNDIFCPFYGEQLGNEFEHLFRFAYYGKKEQEWDVTRNRMMFSMENRKVVNLDVNKSMEVVGNHIKPIVKELAESSNQSFFSNPIVNASSNAVSNFLSKIMTNTDILKILEKANKTHLGEGTIYNTNVLDIIKKNKPDLYSAIVKWGENEYNSIEELVNRLIVLKNLYRSESEQLKNKLSLRDVKQDIAIQDKLNYEQTLTQLYESITNEVLKNEQSKRSQTTMGGKSKSKSKSKSKNRKQNKSSMRSRKKNRM